MTGQRQKDPEALSDRRTSRATNVAGTPISLPRRRNPACPKRIDGCDLATHLVALWGQLWRSDLARFWSVDVDARILMERYILALDEEYVLRIEVAGDGHTVEGSTGQRVLHPNYQRIGKIEAVRKDLEDRLGLSPLSRFRQHMPIVDGADRKARQARNAERAAKPEEPKEAGIEMDTGIIDFDRIREGRG